MTTQEPLLSLTQVCRTYRSLGGLFNRRQFRVPAVQDVSLNLHAGDTLGLVGESGSGKSTLARLIIGLDQPDSGQIVLDRHTVNGARGNKLRQLRRTMQMVFQNPYGALDPLQRIGSALTEPLCSFEKLTPSDRERAARQGLADVGLPARLLNAYPHQLSGGERQRVCIARALSVKPKLLICDEAVSALDKTVQAQVLRLLRELQQRHGLAILFISHDLAAVNVLCNRVAVMLKGRIVEEGPCADVLASPAHDYTRALLRASHYLERSDGLHT
jgi:peptide/nickel transport system ATP-binding protein